MKSKLLGCFLSDLLIPDLLQYVVLLLFCLGPVCSIGQLTPQQETEIDSLKQVIAVTKNDTVKLKAWLKWNGLIYKTDARYSIHLMEQVIAFCQKRLDAYRSLFPDNDQGLYKKSMAMAMDHLGHIYKSQGDRTKAFEYFTQSLSIYKDLELQNQMEQLLEKAGKLALLEHKDSMYVQFLKQDLQLRDELVDSLFAQFLYLIGVEYEVEGNYSKALESFYRSLKLYERLKIESSIAKLQSQIGVVYSLRGDYAKSIEILIQSLQRREKIGDQKGVAYSLTDIGYIYAQLEDYSKAREYFERSLKIREEHSSQVHIAGGYFDMGYIYTELGDYDKAMEYHRKSLELRKALGIKIYISTSLSKIGNVYKKQGKYTEALSHYNQSVQIDKEIGNNLGLAVSLNNLGEVYRIRKNYAEAIRLNKKALSIALDTEELVEIKNSYQALYRAYKQTDRKALALEMFEKYALFRDSIQRKEDQRAVIRQEYKYQYEKQALSDSLQNAEAQKLAAAELKAQKAQNLQQRQLGVFIGIGLLSLLIFSAFTFYRRRRTLKKRLQEEHKEANRLKELDQFKSKLYTNLTHEFRTPLTVILGMAEKIRMEPKHFAEQGTHLIERNGKNLLRIINQLLDLSKLEDHSLKLQLQQDDIILYISYITESFHSFANGHNLSLRFFSNQESLMMDYDTEQIKQVMTNLISNAIKFTPSGGEVRVRVLKKEDWLQIEVRDDGIGIPEKALPYIFDRFYQVDDSSTRAFEGTGVGLAHTKELVKLMDGEVTVESILEQGSTFVVRLPIRNEAPVAKPRPGVKTGGTVPLKPEVLSPPISSGKADLPVVLIVEDNPDVVVYLKSCLDEDFHIDVAYNGSVGIEKAIESVPDLVICDVMMPEKNGFEVCSTLKTDERTSHIPIILLTAKADLTSKLTGLERGADAYLAKPFNQKELLIRMHKLLESRHRMREFFSRQYLPYSQGEPVHAELDADSKDLRIENAFIQKINVILEENIGDEDFGLIELRKKAGMSRSQFFRKMKALTNTAPSDYIRKYRLQKAKYFLEHTDHNVAEVAYKVGYKNPSYFSHVFQKAFGYPPSTLKH